MLAGLAGAGPAWAAEEFSAAERALFVDKHLSGLQPPLTLRYSFSKGGSLEAGFDDTVDLVLAKQANGSCCSASARFLSGERQLRLPEVESAEGNPVILYFLERDIREMQRLTKGQHNYFRKRIRMAVFNGAEVRPVSLNWRGRQVAGREIRIAPYMDDPLRARFENLANKQYLFTLSEAVPGGVYSIRATVAGQDKDAPALLVEEIRAEGATAPPIPRRSSEPKS